MKRLPVSRLRALLATIWIAMLAIVPDANAALIRIPLSIPYLTLREALKSQLYTAPGGIARLWNGSDECQSLSAEHPEFAGAGPEVKFETDVSLSLGVKLGATCVSPIAWRGIVETTSTPYVTADWHLKFRVTDINLYNPQHEKTFLVGRGFDLIKDHLIRRLEEFSFDLNPHVRQLDQLIQLGAPPDVAKRVEDALRTLRPLPPPNATDRGVQVTLALVAPELPMPPTPRAAPPLTPADIEAWQNALDGWDAFVVFAIKQLGLKAEDRQVRDALFDLLLDSRYRLIEALRNPQPPGGPDPVRLLFMRTWTGLSDIVQDAARRGLLGDRTLQFLTFLSAGDALAAFDQAAPALGMRISAADLRRLAHIMAPTYAGDPLAFSYAPDPDLLQLFQMREPPQNPDALEAPSPSPTPSDLRSSGREFLRLLGPQETMADETDQPTRQIRALGQKLRRVVLDRSNVGHYSSSIGQLLELTGRDQLDSMSQDDKGGDALLPAYQRAYVLLVKSTAWQESCWRQFIRADDGTITYLKSSTGDIGLMQINRYVWRGFYSIPRLEWDIVYNVGAGTQILMRLMRGVIRRAHGRSPPEAIARSSYAAYNGGPDAFNRWRRKDEPRDLRMVDAAFWDKYRAVDHGQPIDLVDCTAHWGKGPGR